MSRILVAAAEPTVAARIQEALGTGRSEVTAAADGPSALAGACSGPVDLLVLDLALPDLAAVDLLRGLRRARSVPRVLVLAGAGDLPAAASALEEGADDYLLRPFDRAELLVRVRLLLRQGARREANVLRHGDLVLDLRTRRAGTLLDNVQLTGREFAVLEALIQGPDQVVSRELLLSRVWGYYHFDPGSNLVEVYVRRLRRKLGPGWVTTVRGRGYRLERHVPRQGDHGAARGG